MWSAAGLRAAAAAPLTVSIALGLPLDPAVDTVSSALLLGLVPKCCLTRHLNVQPVQAKPAPTLALATAAKVRLRPACGQCTVRSVTMMTRP